MSRELKKFLFTFSVLTVLFVFVTILIALFSTDHWIIGLILFIPALAALFATITTDILSVLEKKVLSKKEE